MAIDKARAGVTIGDPWAETPAPAGWWRGATAAQRSAAVAQLIGPEFELVEARESGAVTLALRISMNAAERGLFLRAAERLLKDGVDPAIIVHLAAKQDRNILRRLRGVEVQD